ncbi:acyl carrier protein [Sneathiella sp. P13V-1]|uniref:phosphopantetheine-binding protein n=1 Tax=Sneathiella sp. P13V-1 TaxID=2697366 RepID=UPI00187B5D85|nr:phosphopantetheine-binding protein [Sneathiella sp. P13V-1]MBE7636522.1 acyl carrier protein [Sneathiella sp. P13V-1]
MDNLIQEIKELIIKALELEDISAADIDENEALFDEGLGLDSIDALELGVALQKKYGVKIENKKEDLAEHFANVNTLANFITEMKAQGESA